MARLHLPTVTLCAVTSVNVAATVVALERCQALADFGDCLLLTDALEDGGHPGIIRVPIAPIRSAAAYSDFVLRELHRYVDTDHVLIVQWDGFIVDPAAWDDAFLACDYIGATWPQFGDDAVVGNGGFSLRSRRLLEACLDPRFVPSHPEDVSICRENRELLHRHYGIHFADASLANRFSYERRAVNGPCFGFHGVFNMPAALGNEAFWRTYQVLDERSSVRTDFRPIWRAVLRGKGGLKRAVSMLYERWRDRKG